MASLTEPRRRHSARLLPSLIGAAGVILWASETTLITFTTAIPPLQTVALAFVFATMLSPLVWLCTGSGPAAAFQQPPRVWLIVVGALVGYHACIYYATQQAPPAAAALLQGTTPLMIVLASGLLPGERLRWWHVAGAALGMIGVMLLIDNGGETPGDWMNARFYLSLIGIAAALWGLYAIVSRTQSEVPTSALGTFYAASALVCLVAHAGLETWVAPSPSEWAAIAGLGILPMGLAIYFWDHGIKRGDIQALGAFAYVEPFIGAVLVALFTAGMLDASLLLPGVLVIGGAILASTNLWGAGEPLMEASAVGVFGDGMDDAGPGGAPGGRAAGPRRRGSWWRARRSRAGPFCKTVKSCDSFHGTGRITWGGVALQRLDIARLLRPLPPEPKPLNPPEII